VKRFGPEATLFMGCILMAAGTAAAGFMPTWWSFQLVWSPIVGLGFAFVHTCTSVVSDKFATQGTRPKVHTRLFMMEQGAMFFVGPIYGTMLEVAKTHNKGYYFWLVATGFATLLAILFLLVWRFVIAPATASKKKAGEEKKLAGEQAKLAAGIHQYDFKKESDPTDEDYIAWGKYVVDLLHSRNYLWKQREPYVKRAMDNFLIELPTDTVEHRMEILWEQQEVLSAFNRNRRPDIDRFYDILNGLALDQSPGAKGGADYFSEASKRG
jgi:MFS family permease